MAKPESVVRTWLELPTRVFNVEQVVVYSTLPQEYSPLTFRGEVIAVDGRVEERSEVIYWHRTNTVIYYMYHNGHSCIA